MVEAIPGGNPLEERYSHEIMIALLTNGRMMKTDLLRSVSKSSCMIGRLDRLEEAGLVEIVNDRFSNNTKWVSLTPKGKKVARLLEQLAEAMDEGSGTGRDSTSGQYASFDEEGAFAQPIPPKDNGEDVGSRK